VHVFLVNSSGRIFLHQRSLTKDTYPGLWNSSCAGHVAAGDDYDVTVVRELEEELSCRLSAAPQRLFRVDPCVETSEEFVWVYRARADGPFVLNAAEIQRGDWFSAESIDAWVARAPEQFARSFLFLWPRVRGILATAL
jgi:isopentenyl-diphosphate Delta-isomerase